MNSDQDFEDLRKLLALKKYEQPPPRYFSELPGRIWVRIEREGQTTSFWARFVPNLGLSPALAYSFGLLACGTLVFGIGYSLRTESAQTATTPLANENGLLTSPRLATKGSSGVAFSNYQATQLASTNPVMNSEPLPSLFNTLPVQVAPVNYSPGQ
jgi:hypothetical protein